MQSRSDSSDSWSPPPSFWDNLSKLWLTRRALRELNRRNSEAEAEAGAAKPSHSLAHQQSTADDYFRCLEPHIQKDIRALARHGGPDLLDLRNYPTSAVPFDEMSSRTTSSQGRKKQNQQQQPPKSAATPASIPASSVKTSKTGPYDSAFEQHLIDHAIYPHNYKYHDGSFPPKAENHGDFKEMLARRRPSLSESMFTEKHFEKLAEAESSVPKEKQVSESVITIIEGDIVDFRCRGGGIPFKNFEDLTNGELKPGNPDVYYGARPEQLNPKIRREIGSRIIPSTQHDLPIAPNFFLAVKGPDGSPSVAKRQACYDGALGARGMLALQSYGQDKPVYDHNAYTITCTYMDGVLRLYTIHIISPRSSGGMIEYHMTQLRTCPITDDRDSCVAGLRAFRNAREWAAQQRDAAIRGANQRVAAVSASTSTALSLAQPAAASGGGRLSSPSRTSFLHTTTRRNATVAGTKSSDSTFTSGPQKWNVDLTQDDDGEVPESPTADKSNARKHRKSSSSPTQASPQRKRRPGAES